MFLKLDFSNENMKDTPFSFLKTFFVFLTLTLSSSATRDDIPYDYSAYTSCKDQPEDPLYDGGIINFATRSRNDDMNSPALELHNLTGDTIYSFSAWVKISGADSAVIKASLTINNTASSCIGNVVAKPECWSFLKGGFVLDSPTDHACIYFENSIGEPINITIESASLQPFRTQQWQINQQNMINNERKRAIMIHVSDVNGKRIEGASIKVQQVSRDFPLGSAISKSIIGNLPYQSWFLKRFNAAVFENELKWYSTEPEPGKVDYTIPDQMLYFICANQITVRGHNIFWENPIYTPSWVRNLTGPSLKAAVESRIQSLMSHYKNEFVHWDVSNEMLHYAFYEQTLGPNATLDFFKVAHDADPLATMFMSEFNVVETCDDSNSTVDTYISRLMELERGGVSMDGIGLEGHFTIPNPALIRAVLDKLATLDLPIWLTEVDISNILDKDTQAKYLEVVLRETFSHPAVNGIILWTALDPNGCYQMCLTDDNFNNLPAGDVVDKLLKEWQTGLVQGETDDHGTFSFEGYLGEHNVTVSYEDRIVNSTLSICRGDETRHFSVQL